MRPAVLTLALLLSLPLAAQEAVVRFSEPSSLRYTGMGGALTAVPEGLDLLLHNPAGFTQPLHHRRDQFILSLSTQLYFKPQYLLPILEDVPQAENKLGQILLNAKDLVTSSGLGATPNISLGYLGRSWGIGLMATASAFVQGSPFPLGTEGFAMVNLTIPMAYSLRVVEGRQVDISLGAALRPGVALYRMIDGSDVDAIVAGRTDLGELVDSILETPYLTFPADLGFLMVGHDFLYPGTQLRLAATLKNLFGDYFVPGQSVEPLSRRLALNLGLGAYFPLEIWRLPVDITLSAETKAINQLLSGTQTFWKSLAFGAELAVADLLRLWGGLASGYPALGCQLDLGVLSLGAAWQTIESGRYVGDRPLSIFQIACSIRL